MTFWIWVRCRTGKTAWTVVPRWWMLSPLTRHLGDANKDKCSKFFRSVKCTAKRNDREKLRTSFQSQRWINYIIGRWKAVCLFDWIKDIYLNQHVQSVRTLNVTAMPNLQPRIIPRVFIIHLPLLQSWFSSVNTLNPFQSGQNQAACISSLLRWRLHPLSLGPDMAGFCCFKLPPPSSSGHQTQTRDLCREEGVQDEDNGLWTWVEVQLLEDKETIYNIHKVIYNMSDMYEKHFHASVTEFWASFLNISMLTPAFHLGTNLLALSQWKFRTCRCQNGGHLFILLRLLVFFPSSNKGLGQLWNASSVFWDKLWIAVTTLGTHHLCQLITVESEL